MNIHQRHERGGLHNCHIDIKTVANLHFKDPCPEGKVDPVTNLGPNGSKSRSKQLERDASASTFGVYKQSCDFPSPFLPGGVRGGAVAVSASAGADHARPGEPRPRPLPVKNGEGRPQAPLRPPMSAPLWSSSSVAKPDREPAETESQIDANWMNSMFD